MSSLHGIRVSDSAEDLVCYGFDASGLSGNAAMVAWPQSADEVSRLISYASARGMAVVPRGAGTGMTAGSVPSTGAMVISLEAMAAVTEIDPDNLTVMVEPGLVNAHLQSALAPYRLFYPPDPASLNTCTIGGNVAENAGGPRALKYGVTRDYVMRLEAVLPTGELITTGVRTHKGVVGFDLTRLLVGSEGTLAVVTKILLKTLPVPESVATLLAGFKTLEEAGSAVAAITRSGIIPRTLEIMDHGAIGVIEGYKPGNLPSTARGAGALLLIELDGHPRSVEDDASRVADICQSKGGSISEAKNELERSALWDSRRAISPALHRLDLKKINEDIVVPRSRLAEMFTILDRLSAQSGIRIVSFGHAGDGNIHVNIMVQKDNPEALDKGHALVREMFGEVLRLGGTISGEHGVGLTKAPYIGMEIGQRELGLMREIKRVFDPKGILNPGKVFGAG